MNLKELLVGAFLLLFVSCVKENNCTVSKIYTGNETVSEISVNENTTVLTIEKEYIVALECY